MAVRFREGRKTPWQTYWNNPFTGKRESANFATELEAKKHDSLIKHRLKFERESFKKEENEEQETGLTIESVFCAYLKFKKPNKKAFRRQLLALKRVIAYLGNKSLDNITRKDIQDAITKMRTTDRIKDTSVRQYFTHLRAVLYWASEQGFCTKIDFPVLPKNNYERFIPPSREEIAQIMEHASPHIVRTCIIGSQFGVRIGESELLRLTWDDVDFDRKVLRVKSARKNENCPWREIPIRDCILPILQQWHLEDAEYGNCNIVNYWGRPLRQMYWAWKGALKRAGIKRRIRLYDLRHAFATEAIAGGADIGTVANLMGHANANMILKHYQYVTDKQKLRAIDALPEPLYVPKQMCPDFEQPLFSQ